MNSISKALIATLVAFVSVAAGASDIWKWTDAEGNVHYGDRPTDETSRRVAIESRPTDPVRVQEIVDAQRQARVDRQTAEAEANANAPTQEELAAAAAEKERKCNDYRARLERMLQSRRLYRETEDGEREYLNEEEMLAARERVQGQVEEYCSP